MQDHCCDAMECRLEDLRWALSIHTQKITDSCRDKDCIEDLRVYLTRESQAVLDAAAAAKVRSAELIYTAIDVSPVAFHPNHYTIDLTFYYKIIADAAVGPCRPAAICGLALFSKRAVLCGENSGAHIFRSDSAGNTGTNLPAAVVEAVDTNSLWLNNQKNHILHENPPTFNTKKSGDFVLDIHTEEIPGRNDATPVLVIQQRQHGSILPGFHVHHALRERMTAVGEVQCQTPRPAKFRLIERGEKLWKCNDQIAAQNMERLRDMDLRSRLTPACSRSRSENLKG